MRFKKIWLALPLAMGWGFWLIIMIVLFSKYSETTRLEDFTSVDQMIFFIGILLPVAGTAITIILDSKWSGIK